MMVILFLLVTCGILLLLGSIILSISQGRKIEVRGLFHAGAFTDSDIVHNLERTYHGFEETLFDCCDRMFLATNDFKNDLLSKRFVDERKISVVPLPLDFKKLVKVEETWN